MTSPGLCDRHVMKPGSHGRTTAEPNRRITGGAYRPSYMKRSSVINFSGSKRTTASRRPQDGCAALWPSWSSWNWICIGWQRDPLIAAIQIVFFFLATVRQEGLNFTSRKERDKSPKDTLEPFKSESVKLLLNMDRQIVWCDHYQRPEHFMSRATATALSRWSRFGGSEGQSRKVAERLHAYLRELQAVYAVLQQRPARTSRRWTASESRVSERAWLPLRGLTRRAAAINGSQKDRGGDDIRAVCRDWSGLPNGHQAGARGLRRGLRGAVSAARSQGRGRAST